MKLVQHCTPLFDVICRVHRAGRAGGSVPLESIRTELQGVLSKLASTAATDPHFAAHWERIELPLLYFIDSMISRSGLSCAEEWRFRGFAAERGFVTGDEDFFRILNEELADRSAAATERVEVLQTCLGLGFEGIYAGDPGYLEARMAACRERLGERPGDLTARVTPDTYEHTDHRTLTQPPARPLSFMVAAFAGLIVGLGLLSMWLYSSGASELEQGLDKTLAVEGRSIDAAPQGSERPRENG